MNSCQLSHLITSLYITSSFMIAFLSALPTIWFIFHHQSSIGSLGIWVTLSNLIHAINSTVWRKDVINRAPIWCDLSSKIILIYSTGSICSCLCMARFLAYAMSPNPINLNHQTKKLINLRNWFFSLGFPIFLIPFSYLYSPFRFSLVSSIGCETSYQITWPTFFFFIIWSPIFSTIASIYTSYVAVRLWKTRKVSNDNPKNHGSKVPLRRLAWLCLMYTIVAFPLSIYYAYLLVFRGTYVPYQIHAFESTSGEIQYISNKRYPDFNDSLSIIGGLVFVGFFTFSKEMKVVYKRMFDIMIEHFLFISERFQDWMKDLRNRIIFKSGSISDDLELSILSKRHGSIQISSITSIRTDSIEESILVSNDEEDHNKPTFFKAFRELHHQIN
ncbi:STE3-like pheromone receptor [Melampsora larici-populina 98AG31]|uniref:STE3-like pheromone receptor n=1 Tax=Melampsora larici-populina (strain 98AG31 / pathotype 3-4-7) TaxID=747676 RepID=F4R869_MELLP|nr:STE3-like pheromone receptor [Melampsora larici-populina 98AG31]EGG11666.1 STE3-like pheromone receptor [Melampsora larici-populina 98AG31]